MGAMIPWILLVVAIAGLIWLGMANNDLTRDKDLLQDELRRSNETIKVLQNKYEILVGDLKKIALRPQIVSSPDTHKPRRAASSGELRRLMEQDNQKAPSEQDRAAG